MTDVEGRVVLVTGGTGFIGSHLVQALNTLRPAEIRVLARSTPGPTLPVTYIRGEIDDSSAVALAVRGAQVVFHLAAMKNVPDCEARPAEAARVNVEGARVLVGAILRESGIERLVAVSSTSAVTAGGVYGRTKAAMERVVIDALRSSRHPFAVVRLGNVWGAPSSVIDVWTRSAAMRRIDVTDPEMTRFALTVDEAVALLLDAAAAPHRGLLVPARMSGYRLGDLAAAFSRRTGAGVAVTGPRVGEDRHEQTLSLGEQQCAEVADGIIVVGDRPSRSALPPVSSATARRMTADDLDAVLQQLQGSRVTP